MKLTLPAQGTWDYEIPTTGVSCDLEGYGSLQCGPVEEGSNELEIYGFPATAQAATLNVLISGIINPAKATTTGTFMVEIFDTSSTNVLIHAENLNGLTINAGSIFNIHISAPNYNRNAEVEYTIEFHVHSGIEAGGKFLISFPNDFASLTANSCGVLEGLAPLSGSSVTCAISGRTVNFSNFIAVVEQQAIKVKVTATNPNSAQSGTFTITTQASDNITIDTTSETETISLTNIDTPVSVEINAFKAKTNLPRGGYGPLEIYLQTRSDIPKTDGTTSGEIKITNTAGSGATPTNGNWEVDQTPTVTPVSCTFGIDKVPAATCTMVNNVLTIATPATEDFDKCPLAVTVTTLPERDTDQTAFANLGLWINPAQTGNIQLLVEVSSDINDGNNVVKREEAYYEMTFEAQEFATPPTFDIMNTIKDAPNAIAITFTTGIDVPIGGFIDVEFPTAGYLWPHDIGYGAIPNSVVNYPCAVLTAFANVDTCQLHSGTTNTAAYVRITVKTGVISATNEVIVLPKLRNSNIGGVTPTFKLITRNEYGTMLEYKEHTFTSPLTDAGLGAGTANIDATGTDTITASGGGAAVANELDISLLSAGSANGVSMILEVPDTYSRFASTFELVNNFGTTTTVLNGYEIKHPGMFYGYWISNTSSIQTNTLTFALQKDQAYVTVDQANRGTFKMTVVYDKTDPTAGEYAEFQSGTAADAATLTLNTGTPVALKNVATTTPYHLTPLIVETKFQNEIALERAGSHIVIALPTTWWSSADACIRTSSTTTTTFDCRVDNSDSSNKKIILDNWSTTTNGIPTLAIQTDFVINFSGTLGSSQVTDA